MGPHLKPPVLTSEPHYCKQSTAVTECVLGESRQSRRIQRARTDVVRMRVPVPEIPKSTIDRLTAGEGNVRGPFWDKEAIP